MGSRLVFLDVDDELRWHLVAAMQEWSRKGHREHGLRRPPDSFELLRLELARPGEATSGQERTLLPADSDASDTEVVPLLVDYPTAAGMLAVSARTVRRMVAGRAFEPVTVRGRKLLRTADVVAYAEAREAS